MLYHNAILTMTGDGQISANGIGILSARSTRVAHLKLTFSYERVADKNPQNNQFLTCYVSAGLYSPLHAEAVTWSTAKLLTLTQKAVISLRPPRGTDWGHYKPDDAIAITTIRGNDDNFRVMMLTEAWVQYGPPAAPTKSSIAHLPFHKVISPPYLAGIRPAAEQHSVQSGSEIQTDSRGTLPLREADTRSPVGSEQSDMSVI